MRHSLLYIIKKYFQRQQYFIICCDLSRESGLYNAHNDIYKIIIISLLFVIIIILGIDILTRKYIKRSL